MLAFILANLSFGFASFCYPPVFGAGFHRGDSMARKRKLSIVGDGAEIFIAMDGIKIAQRVTLTRRKQALGFHWNPAGKS
jgi:hypothetical protein